MSENSNDHEKENRSLKRIIGKEERKMERVSARQHSNKSLNMYTFRWVGLGGVDVKFYRYSFDLTA